MKSRRASGTSTTSKVEDFKGPYEEFVAQQAANAAAVGGGKVTAGKKK